MIAILQLVALLVIGYLGTHFLEDRLPEQLRVLSSLGFVLLGVVAGPHVAGALAPESLAQMKPVVSVGLGAIGLMLGLRFRFQRLIVQHGRSLQLAFFSVLACVVLVGGSAVLLVFTLFHPSQWSVALPAALALGTVAGGSGPITIKAVREELDGGGRLGALLETAGRLTQILSVTLFGLIYCAFHVGVTGAIRTPTIVEWMVTNVGIGLALGVLFFLFLGRESDEGRLLLALIGIVLFASGTAQYLNLSPLFTNMILGIMLANTSRRADALAKVLSAIEPPTTLVVLAVAGASLRLSALGQPALWGFVLLSLFLRPLGTALGGWVTYRYAERASHLTPWMGRGLDAQSYLAIAMAVDFTLVYQGLAVDALLASAILSVVVWGVLARPRIRAALRDAEPSLPDTREAVAHL